MRSLLSISLISALNAAFPLLSIIILTRLIPISDFGELVIYETILVLLIPIIHFSLSGIIVEYFKLNQRDFAQYIFFSILLSVPIFLLIQIVFLLFSSNISFLLDLDTNWLVFLPLYCFLNVFIQIPLTIAQCEGDMKKYAFFLIGPTSCTLALTLFLLLKYELGYSSKLYAIGATYIIFSFLSVISLLRDGYVQYSNHPSIKLIKLNLKFTLPLIPHVLSAGLYFAADRLFISKFLSNADVALYAAALQLALVISVIQNSISKGWNPFIMEVLQNKNSFDESIKKIFKYISIGSLILFFIVLMWAIAVLFISDIIFPSAYGGIESISISLIMAYGFLGLYKLFVPIPLFYKKTTSLSKITMFIFLMNIGLNFILIPIYGIIGAAAATVTSMVAQLLLTLFLVNDVLQEQKSLNKT